MDSRIETLAYNLVNYSINVQPGEKVYIHYIGESTLDLARQLVKEVYKAKGIPFTQYTEPKLQREVLLHCTDEQMKLMAEFDSAQMHAMDCYIGVRGSDKIAELSDVPEDCMSRYERLYQTPVH